MKEKHLLVVGLAGIGSLANPERAQAEDYFDPMWPFQDTALPNPTSSSFTWLEKPQPRTVAKVDLVQPEFLTPRKAPTDQSTAPKNAVMTNGKPVQSAASSLIPRTNSQLFNQKRAALKAGKLHSTLTPSSFSDQWFNPNQQITYQDWKNLLAQEAKSIAKGQGNNQLNIMVGDSLSLWFPSASLPKGKFWLNQSISGENTGQILNRIDAIAPTKASTIYIMAGVNDIKQGISNQTILNNLESMVVKFKQQQPHAKIVVQSILPTSLATIPNSRIAFLNQQIVAMTNRMGVDFLDLYPLFTNGTGQLRPDLSTDGLHLNHSGYQVWQDALEFSEAWLASRR